MMNARAKLERAKNQEREQSQKEPYEIPYAKDDWTALHNFKNEEISIEIAKLLLSKNLNYMEMNEVLYQADKALRNRMLQTKLKL